jgi:hypothetical protein
VWWWVGGWVTCRATKKMTRPATCQMHAHMPLASPRVAPPAQLMSPDDMFTSYVQSGTSLGRLADEDLCNLTASHC